MVQIARQGKRDFTCAYCRTVYEVSEIPAHDSGTATCEVCNKVMMKWVDTAIPLFRAKKIVENVKRRISFLGPNSTGRRMACE